MAMKKILLLLLLVSLFAPRVFAQEKDTITYLMITEARMDEIRWNYVEITNMHPTKSVDLSQFEFGEIDSWTDYWSPAPHRCIRLPKVMLGPGKSFTMANIQDLSPQLAKVNPEEWKYSISTIEEWLTVADMGLYKIEFGQTPLPIDSVSPVGWEALDNWAGRGAWYLEQHFADGDSVVVDAVNADQSNPDHPGRPGYGPRDCAGVTGATGNSILIRKFKYKNGSLDWDKQKGVDLGDSEWMPIPVTMAKPWGPEEVKQPLFWTIGNHGNYTLTPESFTSSTIEINYTDTVLTVPWGVRRGWRIMHEFERDRATGKGNGFAWNYHRAKTHEDSAFVSVRTGDVLTIYAAGNELQIWNFDIVTKPPQPGDNIVIPLNVLSDDGTYGGHYFNVSDGISGMDTIYDVGWATRVDTLLKYLEKAPKASWEIVYKDGSDRPDLINGDILKVTAENGAVKNYYIKIDDYLPNHNANLAAITWPDIPASFLEIAPVYGWKGDTIPGFTPSVNQYNFMVPLEYNGVPALVAKTENMNAKVSVQRAVNTDGTLAERTMIFNTTAEDDTTFAQYRVVLEKEKDPSHLQPYFGEPFFSQYVFKEQWRYNTFVEIYNPGNQPLDLSKYMIVQLWSGTAANAVQAYSGTDQWANRWNKYVPGYIWQSESEWLVEPAILVQDLNVNPIVAPGETFVFGVAGNSWEYGLDHHWQAANIDVNFSKNPWGQTVPEGNNAAMKWINHMIYLLRIDNDSVTSGLKPATDPNDFTAIDVMGAGAGNWYVAGHMGDQRFSITRKPHVQKGNPVPGASFGPQNGPELEPFGTLQEGTHGVEWAWYTPNYYYNQGFGWADAELGISRGIGSHNMNPVTFYKSYITSSVYKVSPGYSMDETIRGVISHTTVDEFLLNINKEDPGQSLTLISKATGQPLTGTNQLLDGDALVVLSADSVNTTKYILNVTDLGLSRDAILKSKTYYISVEWTEGEIFLIPQGTTLKTVLQNLTVPLGATLTILDAQGSFVPLQMRNFDSTYVDVLVNDQIFMEVVAEDGVTKILYQLKPDTKSSDAFVTSNLYAVDQQKSNIALVPRGTSLTTFLSNVYPATGATIKVYDKKGYERTSGTIYQDDKLVVTAADGVHHKVYYLTMLLTKELMGETTDYLAYVLSDLYDVDQINMIISGPSSELLVTEFLKNIYASFGATAVVVNEQGTVKTSGDLDRNDMVRVTAADGKTVAFYTLQLDFTSVDLIGNRDLLIYPNPTHENVNIQGVNAGNRIKVVNLLGMTVIDKLAGKSLEVISLDRQPAGIYLITVSDDHQIIGKFKVVKK